jgi:peptidyl-dipeptidase A
MTALRWPVSGLAQRLVLDELEYRLEKVDAAYAEAQWQRHLGALDQDRLRRREAALADLLLNDQLALMLEGIRERADDSLRARRAELLLRRLDRAAIESHPRIRRLRNRIDEIIVAFQPRVGGQPSSRVVRSQILRQDPDPRRRREAWLAMAPLSEQIEAEVRLLLHRRAALARDLGYEDYVAWGLDTAGLERGWVNSFLERLERATDAPYRVWLESATRRLGGAGEVQPWDLPYLAEGPAGLPVSMFSREGLLPAVQRVAAGLGLGDAAAGVRVDAAELPYAALCYAIRPPDDVRILINPRDGRPHYDLLFHEFGHALHWRCLDPLPPVLRRDAPPFTEGMAFLWEWLVAEPDWLLGREGCDGFGLEQVAAARQRWSERTLYRVRLLLARARFEFQAYAAPGGDLLGIFQQIHEKHLGVPFDALRGWATDPYWTSHPVYWQNYLVGQAIASQSLNALRHQFGRLLDRPAVGGWLRRYYYGPGATLPWQEKVRQATGSALGVTAFLKDLLGDLRTAERDVDDRGNGKP